MGEDTRAQSSRAPERRTFQFRADARALVATRPTASSDQPDDTRPTGAAEVMKHRQKPPNAMARTRRRRRSAASLGCVAPPRRASSDEGRKTVEPNTRPSKGARCGENTAAAPGVTWRNPKRPRWRPTESSRSGRRSGRKPAGPTSSRTSARGAPCRTGTRAPAPVASSCKPD